MRGARRRTTLNPDHHLRLKIKPPPALLLPPSCFPWWDQKKPDDKHETRTALRATAATEETAGWLWAGQQGALQPVMEPRGKQDRKPSRRGTGTPRSSSTFFSALVSSVPSFHPPEKFKSCKKKRSRGFDWPKTQRHGRLVVYAFIF